MKNNKLFIPSIASIVFFVLSLIFYGFYQLGDDTYIYLQYAKNILANGELAFNAGQRTYGFTSPVWLGLITAFNYFIKDLTQVPRVLSMLASLGSIYIWYYILKRLFKSFSFWFMLPILFEPNLLKHSNFGMEASLSFFLASLIILQILILKENNYYSYLRISIIAGILFLVRPESIILFAYLLIYLYKTKHFSKNDIYYNLGIFMLIVTPWLIFANNYFGSPLPSTFSAKGGTFRLATFFSTHILDSLKIWGVNYMIPIGIIAAYIFIELKKRTKVSTEFTVLSFIPAIFMLFYALVINREFVYARYYCLVIPFFLYGLFLIIKSIESNKTQYLLIALVSLQFFATTVFISNRSKSIFIPNERAEDQIIEWVLANTKLKDKIVTGRIGKMAYQTDRTIVDPQGIVNTAILPFVKRNETEKYFEEVKPDYLIGDALHLSPVIGTKGKSEIRIIFTFQSYRLVRDINPGETPSRLMIYKLTW